MSEAGAASRGATARLVSALSRPSESDSSELAEAVSAWLREVDRQRSAELAATAPGSSKLLCGYTGDVLVAPIRTDNDACINACIRPLLPAEGPSELQKPKIAGTVDIVLRDAMHQAFPRSVSLSLSLFLCPLSLTHTQLRLHYGYRERKLVFA